MIPPAPPVKTPAVDTGPSVLTGWPPAVREAGSPGDVALVVPAQGKPLVRDGLQAGQEGAVAAAEIAHLPGALARQLGVLARDRGVEQKELGRRPAPDQRGAGGERVR